MSKLVLPKRAERKVPWLIEFAGGLVRGLATVGASGVLTLVALVWLKAHGVIL